MTADFIDKKNLVYDIQEPSMSGADIRPPGVTGPSKNVHYNISINPIISCESKKKKEGGFNIPLSIEISEIHAGIAQTTFPRMTKIEFHRSMALSPKECPNHSQYHRCLLLLL